MLTAAFTLLLCVAFNQTEAAIDVGDKNDINEIADICSKSDCDKYTVKERTNVSSNNHSLHYYCLWFN